MFCINEECLDTSIRFNFMKILMTYTWLQHLDRENKMTYYYVYPYPKRKHSDSKFCTICALFFIKNEPEIRKILSGQSGKFKNVIYISKYPFFGITAFSLFFYKARHLWNNAC